jgi:hypothetical protein
MFYSIETREDEIEKIINYVLACIGTVPVNGSSELTKKYVRSCIKDKVDMTIGEKVIERMLG